MDAKNYHSPLYLVTGALAAFLCVFFIAVLVEKSIFSSFDIAAVLNINGLAGKPFAYLVIGYTELSGEFLWIVLAPVLYIFGGKKGRRGAILMVAAIFLGTLIEIGLGQLYYRPRPYLVLNDLNLFTGLSNDSSYPSGHTVRAFAGALALSYNYRRLSYVMIPFAIAAGLSRIYLGVHYPSDIIGGALLGLGVFLITALILRSRFRKEKRI